MRRFGVAVGVHGTQERRGILAWEIHSMIIVRLRWGDDVGGWRVGFCHAHVAHGIGKAKSGCVRAGTAGVRFESRV